MPQTVLLTGITGFIAKRIALDLLNAGHTVRGSLRSAGRADEVRDALRPQLSDPAALERLSFVELDLTRDEGWGAALQGTDALLHTASPFPMTQPKDENAIIRPAVDGTLRALRAAQAAGVTRVVLTSSVVAIEAVEVGGRPYTPEDWSDLAHPKSSPYYKSKTLAERAAWEFVGDHPEMKLTTINPALVLGAPMDGNFGTSLQLIERIFNGSDPMVPDIGFAVVDVADVSAMHVAALERPETAGNRYIAAASSVTMVEIARHLKATYPDRKIPTRVAPKPVLRLLSLFDSTIKTILPGIGITPHFDASASTRDLGVTFTPWQKATERAAEAIAAK